MKSEVEEKMDNIDIPKPKNIVFRPCPICKNPMEVELIEIRKELIEGEIDLKAIIKEWRHVCPKCYHETSKFIKVCHHCGIPDDTDKLIHNQLETIPERAYYHPDCHRKSQTPYIIIGLAIVFILAGLLFGLKLMSDSLKKSDKAITLINEAEIMARNPFPAEPSDYPLYKEKRLNAIKQCHEAIKINPLYSKAYMVLGDLYFVEEQKQESANTYNMGLKTAKSNNEMELVKQFNDKLKKLETDSKIVPLY